LHGAGAEYRSERSERRTQVPGRASRSALRPIDRSNESLRRGGQIARDLGL